MSSPSRRKKFDSLFVEALKDAANRTGNYEVYAKDVIESAEELAVITPIESSRAHRVGNFLLGIGGFEPRPYNPNLGYHFYLAMLRLERNNRAASRLEPFPDPPDKLRQYVHRALEVVEPENLSFDETEQEILD